MQKLAGGKSVDGRVLGEEGGGGEAEESARQWRALGKHERVNLREQIEEWEDLGLGEMMSHSEDFWRLQG